MGRNVIGKTDWLAGDGLIGGYDGENLQETQRRSEIKEKPLPLCNVTDSLFLRFSLKIHKHVPDTL